MHYNYHCSLWLQMMKYFLLAEICRVVFEIDLFELSKFEVELNGKNRRTFAVY